MLAEGVLDVLDKGLKAKETRVDEGKEQKGGGEEEDGEEEGQNGQRHRHHQQRHLHRPWQRLPPVRCGAEEAL